MKLYKLAKRIKIEKKILNLMLKFLSPSNRLCIIISQNLDKQLAIYQSHLYIRYNRKKKKYPKPERLTA